MDRMTVFDRLEMYASDGLVGCELNLYERQIEKVVREGHCRPAWLNLLLVGKASTVAGLGGGMPSWHYCLAPVAVGGRLQRKSARRVEYPYR